MLTGPQACQGQVGVPGEPGGLRKPKLQQQAPGPPSKAPGTRSDVAPSVDFSTGAPHAEGTQNTSGEISRGPVAPQGDTFPGSQNRDLTGP